MITGTTNYFYYWSFDLKKEKEEPITFKKSKDMKNNWI